MIPASEKYFGSDEPEVRDWVAGEMGWNGHHHERRAQETENDERAAAPSRDGELGKHEFERADCEQSYIGEIRSNGLELHDAKQKQGVEERGDGGDVLFEVGFDATQDVGNAKCQPVEETAWRGWCDIRGRRGRARRWGRGFCRANRDD